MTEFKNYLKDIGEYGVVTEVHYPLITIEGLPHVKSRELVYFESGAAGEVFSIHRDIVEVVLLSNDRVSINERVVRTDSFLTVPVSDSLLGQIITPLGDPAISADPRYSHTDLSGVHKTRAPIEIKTTGIETRASIKKPFESGVMMVDLLLPLGMGQKELIIGDRKTGKTSFLLTAVKNQVQNGSIVVYATIGQKQSSIKKLIEFLKKEKILDRVIVIVTTSFDSPGLIYIAPFAALTIAEYFRDQGKDTLVVLDDLSAHAKYYREVSLIAKRFPGRESYPGDIFHTHARLMERAGNFKVSQKNTEHNEVSITCLPVVETVESDLASYVATNIMAMTDGHIFFDQGTFAKGRRPAVNIPLSVTRVGRQAQSPLKRDINQKLTKLLTAYEEMTNLAHFGAELSGKVQKTLAMGENIYKLLDQADHTVVPDEVQLILVAMVLSDLITGKQIVDVKKNMIQAANDTKNRELVRSLVQVETLYDLQLAAVKHKQELFTLCEITSTVQPSQPTESTQEIPMQPTPTHGQKPLETGARAISPPISIDTTPAQTDVLLQDSTTKKAREKLEEMEARFTEK